MGGELETPPDPPESRWAELGLQAIGRLPATGDLVEFRAEVKLLRVAAVGPKTVALEVIRAAPGDETDIGTRVETPLRDYLEAWGEGTFSAPGEGAETSSSAAPPGAQTTRGAAELTRPSLPPAPLLSAGGALCTTPAVDGEIHLPGIPFVPRGRGGHLGPERRLLAAHTGLSVSASAR